MDNEKLARVGYAYDLAHSKGSAYLDRVKKMRDQEDSIRASQYREKARRHQ